MTKKKYIVGGVALLIFLIVVGAFFIKNRWGVTMGRERVRIGNVVINAEIADSEITRNKGLGGHEPLRDNEGMLFVFGKPSFPAFWMKDMTFPIDIVWIYDDKVTGVVENAVTQMGETDAVLKLYEPPSAIEYAVELRAGAVKELNIKRGDGFIHAL